MFTSRIRRKQCTAHVHTAPKFERMKGLNASGIASHHHRLRERHRCL